MPSALPSSSTPISAYRSAGSIRCQELLHAPVAQCEPEIEPDRVLDDRRREAMSAVGELIHAGSLPCQATRSNPVSVTLPSGCRPWGLLDFSEQMFRKK